MRNLAVFPEGAEAIAAAGGVAPLLQLIHADVDLLTRLDVLLVLWQMSTADSSASCCGSRELLRQVRLTGEWRPPSGASRGHP